MFSIRSFRIAAIAKGVLRLGEDPNELLLPQGLQFDPDRETPLELGDQVAGLGDVEGTGSDEEDVVRPHQPVFRLDVGALHHGEEIPLDALSAHVGSLATLGPRDLVDLVQEDDPGFLGTIHGVGDDVVHVHQALELLLEQDPTSLRHGHDAPLGPLGKHVLEHLHEVVVHAVPATHGNHHPLDVCGLADLQLDLPILELPVPKKGPEFLPGPGPPVLPHGGRIQDVRLARGFSLPLLAREFLSDHLATAGTGHEDVGPGRRARPRPGARRASGTPDTPFPFGRGTPFRRLGDGREEEVQDPVLHPPFGILLHLGLSLLTDHGDGRVHQIPDHGLHVPTHVSDLGELRRLDLHERGPGQSGQPASDLGLPDARGSDEDEVVGFDLVPELLSNPLAPPAVSKRDGHGLLGRVLAHDISVEFGHNLSGGQLVGLGHSPDSSPFSSRTVMAWLV